MICKYYLMIGSDTVDTADNSCIDVSRMIANISDIKTTYTRVDLGGCCPQMWQYDGIR